MQLNLLKATVLVEKTSPCLLTKLKAWLIICFSFLASALAGAGVGLIVYAFGIKSSILATLMAVVGVTVCAYFLMKLRGSVFVPVRAGYVRVLLKQIAQEKNLSGKEQMEIAKSTTEECFIKIENLSKLERQIRYVIVKAFAKHLKIDRLSFNNQSIKQAWLFILNILTSFVSEPILAYVIKKRPAKLKTSSAEALAVFVSNLNQQWKTTLILSIFIYASWVFFVIALIFPINWLLGMLPFSLGYWNIVFALIFAWGIRAALFESIAVAAYVQLFLDQCEAYESDASDLQLVSELSDGYFEYQAENES